MLLVHVAEKDVKPEYQLRVAQSGFENTIFLDVVMPKTLPIYKKIDLLSGVDVFENLSINLCKYFFLQIFTLKICINFQKIES